MVGSNLSIRGDFQLAAPAQLRQQNDGLWVVLWRQRWIFLSTLFCFLIAGLIYSQVARKMYTSVGSFAINPERNDNAEMINRILSTQQKIISSAPVLIGALTDERVHNAHMFENVKNKLAYLKKELRVDVGKRDNTVTVSFDAPSAKEAQDVVESVLGSYQEYVERQKQSTNNPDLEKDRRLKAEREAIKDKLVAEMQTFRDANASVDLSGSFATVEHETLRSLAAALAAAQRETSDAMADFSEAMKPIRDDPDKAHRQAEMVETAPPTSIEAVATLKKELVQLDDQIQELQRQHLLPTHPQMVALRSKSEDLTLRYAVASKKRWQAAQIKEAALKTEYEQQLKKEQDLELKVNRYNVMKDNLARTREEIRALDDRILGAKVVRDTSGRAIVVLQSGDFPEKPSWPNTPIVMLIALVAGSLTGLGFARVREWTAPRLQSLDEVRNALGLPILACIPHWIEHGANPLDPMGDVAEEYADLRETLIASTAERGAKNVLLTAPSHAHGVSTIICNLAKAMAKAGDRILIIDANFRSPAQHTLFDLHPEIGLSTVLAGDNKAEESIRNTGLRGLDLLPSGPIPKRPSDLLKSAAFEDLLREMGTQYDWVLIDAPPATVAPDARIASASCDATILVIRAQKGDRRLAEQAHDALTSVGAQVVGIVINDVPRRGSWESAHAYIRPPSKSPPPRTNWPPPRDLNNCEQLATSNYSSILAPIPWHLSGP